MLADPYIAYFTFNLLEGFAWWVVAIVLPFRIPRRTARENVAVFAASAGFVLFGITDFLEAPLQGQLPWWLWTAKIACAASILGCRYHYLGWHRFRLTDRYFLFGLGCLTASIGAIVLQQYLYGN